MGWKVVVFLLLLFMSVWLFSVEDLGFVVGEKGVELVFGLVFVISKYGVDFYLWDFIIWNIDYK